MAAATVGVAFGQGSDITTEAAGAVVLDNSLQRVDELLHIGRQMRRIAMQSAVGGMLLSGVGMLAAAGGLLVPVAGAVAQEAIDVVAVLNAMRAATAPSVLTDFTAADSDVMTAVDSNVSVAVTVGGLILALNAYLLYALAID